MNIIILQYHNFMCQVIKWHFYYISTKKLNNTLGILAIMSHLLLVYWTNKVIKNFGKGLQKQVKMYFDLNFYAIVNCLDFI